MKKFVLMVLFSLGMVCASFPTFAQDIKAQVSLLNLIPLKLTERGWDQLYMGITHIGTNGKYQYYRIPEFPLHWIMKKDGKIQNQNLWTGVIKEGESITINLALIEQDESRIEVDDLIGEAQVQLTNAQGQLKANWRIVQANDRKDNTNQVGTSSEYVFFGDNGKYQLKFAVNTMPTPTDSAGSR
jgi:hypothetical protein